MVKLNKIYTRTGDDGTTVLVGGVRVRKDDPRVEAYGTVDEANAAIGMALALSTGEHAQIMTLLRTIQHDLFDVGADLATPLTPGEKPGAALRVLATQTWTSPCRWPAGSRPRPTAAAAAGAAARRPSPPPGWRSWPWALWARARRAGAGLSARSWGPSRVQGR